MPPKRKAAPGQGNATKAGRASAMSTPGPATPRSLDSSIMSDGDDDFDEDVTEAQREREALLSREADDFVNKFTFKGKRLQGQDDELAGRGRRADAATRLFKKRDFSYLPLKPDHQNRPLWIDPDSCTVVLERFNPLAEQATDFLITIAEPKSRPTFLHEYALTPHSLYAAVSVGLRPRDIINTLERFLKTSLPDVVRRKIEDHTKSFGKVKLVLKHNKYFVESVDAEVLQTLLKDQVIGSLRVHGSGDITTSYAPTMGGLVIPGTQNAAGVHQANLRQAEKKPGEGGDASNEADLFNALNEEDDDDDKEAVHAFEISDADVETVQKRCLDIGFPILEEYDFRNDDVNPNLEIDLRPNTQIRPYQEKSLSKMFGNGRAKSGIIVLPCGAGKTLVGITAACTIKKGVIVLCTSSMSVVQWRQEFLKWSNINPDDVAIFTAESKQKFSGSTGIIVTTYSMVTNSRERSHDSKKMMDFLRGREWGLMLLDEVHVVPAEMFRRGHIAKVQCAEVWCPMPTEFYDEYLRANARMKRTLYAMNPRKFQACQYLINYHEARGDKIIVFSDELYSLKQYALKLKKVFIYGGTSQNERMQVLENFQHNPEVNTLFLSKIGDTSLDLPEATCLIQISSHFGSRRQEAQRLGRILRAKRRNDEGFNAFFYSLVSKDTQEMYYSSKRQAFLVDQGYAFKVITQLANIEKTPDLAFATPLESRELLQRTLVDNERGGEDDVETDDLFGKPGRGGGRKAGNGVRRTAGMLSELAGGQDMAYIEQNKAANKALKGKGKKGAGGDGQSKFFKGLQREKEKSRARG
ncbi:hypothetical protein CHGG_05716 [Chaetomium globosum CBS 148.51]|uniref:Uncharacterized protein n=1 Tax=Chaetomium globosum (strain ATCC 6205 / CBS 148.51 / DSM 1962 / NBRC 6347 / NRRL 1970) TaxID=306901 RepID=Q2H6J9_CHAGB|nr:uncharacterized protein CHGG_05716 [Chaetomium globosum CBS 148.51]EAQ89097.1 hypothetical protein CHGG_05716 [Chaetomium globosum CBS 148.51]